MYIFLEYITQSIIDILNYLVKSYGLLGIFIVSLIGNAIPYFTVPYLLIIALYGSTVELQAQIFVALSGGFGAAIGKVIILLMGRVARYILSEESKKNLEVFLELARKSIFLAILLFAALPVPDDILYFPLGVSGYSPFLFFSAVAIGKIFITWLAVAFGYLIISIGKYPWWISSLTLIVLTLIITYLTVKINWIKAMEIGNKAGLLPATLYVIRSSIEILFKPFIKILKRS